MHFCKLDEPKKEFAYLKTHVNDTFVFLEEKMVYSLPATCLTI